MGIQSKLLKSIIVLVVFYLGIGSLYFFASTIEGTKPYLDAINYPSSDITTLNQLYHSYKALEIRSIEVAIYFSIGILFSVIIFILFIAINIFRRNKLKRNDNWEDLIVTVTSAPKPVIIDISPAELEVKKILFSHVEKRLLNEIMGYCSQYSNHYMGAAHTDNGLLKHTLSVLNKAVDHEEACPLLILAAAAHDIGKTLTFISDGDGGYDKISNMHDFEGAKILKRFGSWYSLDQVFRMKLYYIVKYQHHSDKLPSIIPSLSNEDKIQVNSLINAMKVLDGEVTKLEKETAVVDSELPIEDMIFNGFVDLVKNGKFSNANTPRKAKTLGFRFGVQLFVFEYAVREHFSSFLGSPHIEILDLNRDSKNSLSTGMELIRDILMNKNIILLEALCPNNSTYRVGLESPFWDIKVGDIDFRSMMVFDVPKDLQLFMAQQSAFPVKITSPYNMVKSTEVCLDNTDDEDIPSEAVLKTKYQVSSKADPASNKTRPSKKISLSDFTGAPEEGINDRKSVPSNNRIKSESDNIDQGSTTPESINTDLESRGSQNNHADKDSKGPSGPVINDSPKKDKVKKRVKSSPYSNLPDNLF